MIQLDFKKETTISKRKIKQGDVVKCIDDGFKGKGWALDKEFVVEKIRDVNNYKVLIGINGLGVFENSVISSNNQSKINKKKLRLQGILSMLMDEDLFEIKSNFIYIKYPKLDMQNSKDDTHDIIDLIVKVNINNLMDLQGLRTTLRDYELKEDYSHSHLRGIVSSFSNFCLGTSEYRVIAANTEDVLDKGLVKSTVTTKDLDQIIIYINTLKSMFSWESLEGTPWRYIRNLNKDKITSEEDVIIEKTTILEGSYIPFGKHRLVSILQQKLSREEFLSLYDDIEVQSDGSISSLTISKDLSSVFIEEATIKNIINKLDERALLVKLDDTYYYISSITNNSFNTLLSKIEVWDNRLIDDYIPSKFGEPYIKVIKEVLIDKEENLKAYLKLKEEILERGKPVLGLQDLINIESKLKSYANAENSKRTIKAKVRAFREKN